MVNTVDLSNNPLQTVSALKDGCKDLEYLDIMGHKMVSMSYDYFIGCSKVVQVRIKEGPLVSVEPIKLLGPSVTVLNFKRKNKSTASKSKPPLCPNIKLLRKHACSCTCAPGSPDMTSCKVCSLMRVNLKIYSKLRSLLYYNAGEVRASTGVSYDT